MLDLGLETSHQIIPIGISIEIRVFVGQPLGGAHVRSERWKNSVEIKTCVAFPQSQSYLELHNWIRLLY